MSALERTRKGNFSLSPVGDCCGVGSGDVGHHHSRWRGVGFTSLGRSDGLKHPRNQQTGQDGEDGEDPDHFNECEGGV